MAKYTFLHLAEEVLRDAPRPLSGPEIWSEGRNKGLAEKTGTTGRTPARSLSAQLGTDVRRNPDTPFCVISNRPQRFFLKARKGELTPGMIEELQARGFSEEEELLPGKPPRFQERDMHPLLAYFVHDSETFSFWGERQIYTKTIDHNKSTHVTFNEWLHPDMVGVYLPFGDMDEQVIDFNKKIGQDSLVRFYSFELKKELTKGNYRQSYFQAVSNSSWANEGYLVAADISEDDALRRELDRLVNAFGIGVICLYPSDFYASEVLFPAKPRPFLDWATFNKLYEANEDFSGFIKRVKRDFGEGEIFPQYYEEILEDPTDYIKRKLKIEQEDPV